MVFIVKRKIQIEIDVLIIKERFVMKDAIELTILMPCLNEAETLQVCIEKAKTFLATENIQGEVLIADNGSTDGSVEIAKKSGARVIHIEQKGYGSALISGCNEAYGKYVIMGDADDSYDFTNLLPFVDKLREGYDLVMGNRFKGGIEKGAMPWLHRYIGNPVLSFIGRLFFNSNIKDFHCGLRGYNRENIQRLGLKTLGMEYASEMVVMSELAGLKITEVPTTLKRDGRSRPPHLRSFRDGWRHLKFLFMYSPNWLFLYPGIILVVLGLIGGCVLGLGNREVGNTVFSINTLLFFMSFITVGVNIIYLFLFTKIYAFHCRFIPNSDMALKLEKYNIDGGIFIGIVLFVLGIVFSIVALYLWRKTGYSELVPNIIMRVTIPAVTFICVGVQIIFSSFFIGILNIKTGDNSTV